VALVTTDVSEERIASIIRVTRIGELGTLAVTINRSSPILVTLMMEAIHSSEASGLKEPHGVTSHKTAFFTERENFHYISSGLTRARVTADDHGARPGKSPAYQRRYKVCSYS
jgi:N-acetylglutamate synthase-like GNAT family acetyltransferase